MSIAVQLNGKTFSIPNSGELGYNNRENLSLYLKELASVTNSLLINSIAVRQVDGSINPSILINPSSDCLLLVSNTTTSTLASLPGLNTVGQYYLIQNISASESLAVTLQSGQSFIKTGLQTTSIGPLQLSEFYYLGSNEWLKVDSINLNLTSPQAGQTLSYSNGSWINEFTIYQSDFTINDWLTNIGGVYNLVFNHNLNILNPQVGVVNTNGNIIRVDLVETLDSNNVRIRVPRLPDLRFAGSTTISK